MERCGGAVTLQEVDKVVLVLMMGKRSASRDLTTGVSTEIGRKDLPWSGDLPGLAIGMIRAVLQIPGIVSVDMLLLKR